MKVKSTVGCAYFSSSSQLIHHFSMFINYSEVLVFMSFLSADDPLIPSGSRFLESCLNVLSGELNEWAPVLCLQLHWREHIDVVKLSTSSTCAGLKTVRFSSVVLADGWKEDFRTISSLNSVSGFSEIDWINQVFCQLLLNPKVNSKFIKIWSDKRKTHVRQSNEVKLLCDRHVHSPATLLGPPC